MSRHHNQEYNSETSSSSSQDYESSTSSRTFDEEPVHIAPSMTITNKILQRSDKSTEVIDLNTIAYDEKTLIGIDRSIKDPKLEINNDVDTVTFGKYVFIGIGKHFETSKKSVSPLKENNSLHLNTGRQYSVNDTCEISRSTVDFSVKRKKTDKSIPYEKGIQLRAASMKPKDPLKTIIGKENSQSDNMICPQNKTYHLEESPMEKIENLTLKNKDTTDTKAEIKKNSIIYNDQKKASDEKVSNGQGEICSNCLSYIGRKTLKWLEFDLLNTDTDSRTLSTLSSSQLQLKECKSQLERKMSEGSNVGSRDWKKTMKVTDNTELSLNLNNVPTSFLNSVSKEFLRSSDSTTSEFLGDSCFTKENCLSMEYKIHETCVKALINKIETLLYETDVSDFSDSGTSCMHTQSSLSKKFTTPISISSLSNTDNSTISKKEKYKKPERNNDSIICKRTSRTEVKETNLSTVNKVSEETIPAMEIISKRQNTAPEVINRNNNTNYIDNNICMVYNKDEDYIFQLPKKEHESIKDKASYKNLLKIKVVNNGNNLTLSFISQHRQITPSKEYSPLPHVYCTNFHSTKKIAMHKYFVMNNYKIYKANMFCCIIEEYLCIIWEQIRLIECSEKIILALDRYSRYASEQLNEITANQIFCLEFPLPSFDIQISLIVPKASEHDFERKRTCGASFHKMLTSGLEPAPSSIEISSGSTGAEACADYHTSSCFDLSIAGINPMNIIPRSETLENLCSSLSTNSDMLLTPSKVNILSSNNKSSDMLVQEDIHQLRDSTNPSNDDLSLNQSKIFESDKYQDCTVSQQNEQHETSIYDLTTPDTVNGIIAAFTHIPNGTAILSSTSHTLVQPLQNVFPPSNNLEDLLEALSNFNSVVNAEEESFQSDLSSLENYLERMTSNTTVDSSYEEVGRSQVMSIQHIGHEVKTLEIPREFEGLQEYYLVTKCSTNELQTFAEIKEEMPNLLEDTMNKLKNEHYRSSVYTNIQSLSLHQADELSVKYDNGSIKTLQEEILENYLPDEDTRIMLQNILSEVLEDVVDVEANQEFMDAESIRSLQNDCGNMSETIMKLFPPSLENKSIPITDIVDQIKKDLILDERIKNKINILDKIIHKDSVTTQKLVQRITSELSLIPREEMELFMAQIFGLDLATFTLDSLYHDMNNEAKLDVQCTMYNIECEIEASSKNSDLTISQTTIDQLDKEISQIEQLLEVVTEKSCNIAGEVSKQYSGDNLKALESNCSPAMAPQMHGSSEQGLKSTIEPNVSEWTELYHDSLERLAAASEFATFETINDELKVENVDEREGNILEPALEENILMIHSVLNAEEQVLSGAGDGIVTPRNALHRHESHFSAWAVLSLEDMVRNTPIHHPLNVQTSSLSVVVSNSVADYSTNSAVTSISDMSAFSHEELNSFIKIQEKDTSSRVDTLKSEKSMGTKIMQSIEYIKLNENSTTMKETSKTNVTVSRRTKAFATIYFILFSLIFGGLAMHSQCQ